MSTDPCLPLAAAASEPPPFADGELVVYSGGDGEKPPRFALARNPHRQHTRGQWTWTYTTEYVQNPETGKPSGGSSFPTPADTYHLPTSHEERWIAAQYRAAARVIAARAELAAATAEHDAVRTAAAILARDAS